MRTSGYAIAGGVTATLGVILLMSATQLGWGQPALAAPATSTQPAIAVQAPTTAPSSSTVEGGGLKLRSVSVNFPRSEITFPGGREADVVNNDCLLCHSAGMVLDQASLSRAAWQDEVEKMRNVFKAPFPTKDVPVIVDYLVNLRDVMSRTTGSPPDANHGAVIAAQGTAAGAPACAQCHAFDGASDGSGAFPRITGQSAYYLAKQLRDFASGVRENAIMSPIAKALDARDIADVSAYYAGMKAPEPPLKSPPAELVKRGAVLATVGSAERGIQACNSCHGPAGSGEPPVIPYLAGQYSQYIVFTLDMWQRGFRKNSPEAMAVIAKKLDAQEIAAVTAYYQQVRSPLEAAEAQRKD
jgi:cytochrome c553